MVVEGKKLGGREAKGPFLSPHAWGWITHGMFLLLLLPMPLCFCSLWTHLRACCCCPSGPLRLSPGQVERHAKGIVQQMRRTLRHGYHAYVPKGALLKTDMLASSPQLVTAVFRETEAAAERADRASDDAGFFSRPRLNYPVASGIPAFISRRQFDVQYNIFHHDAVETLNRHTLGTSLEGHSLETVIRRTSFDATQAAAHTAAAEHFNYCFFYKSLRPWGTAVPKQLREAFQLQYGRDGSVDVVEEVKRLLTVVVLSHQERCGWVYLVWTGKQFDVVEFPHGACPIGSDLIPLLAINVHEGAYSLDYGLSGLEQYAQNYFRACNWFLAERYYLQATGRGSSCDA
ncbi:hypothetical protein ECC02_000050 [Trypanosoma cruzi]|uniref:Manganese/iron superoxide dismutase C-terminal domain-containing protein n=1 Tax=Trypanosoma cruzi TaxID=5693 RepID=A0A7J6YJ15_TRYCR|nr:hypothetical protein ECC02_000050 [Trypanosoma cruzi]